MLIILSWFLGIRILPSIIIWIILVATFGDDILAQLFSILITWLFFND